MRIDPQTLDSKLRYNLLIGTVVPRPIAVVGTYGADGTANLAPFSFFNAISADPPLLALGIANNARGTDKDSLRNLLPQAEGGRGGLTINIAHLGILQKVVACAEPLPPDESEFDLSGLTPIAAQTVDAPRLAEARVCFECRTHSVQRFRPGHPGGGNLVLAEVVLIHLEEGLANERFHIDPARLDAPGRLGGFGYCTIRERAEIPPGREALENKVEWKRGNGIGGV